MNCLKNLHICKASCCRNIVIITELTDGRFKFDIPKKTITQDKKRYYELHGVKVKRLPDRSFVLFFPNDILDKIKITYNHKDSKDALLEIPLICQALKDNKCLFHGTEKKPSICRTLDEKSDKEKVIITGGCILKNKGDDKIERNRSN